MNHRLIYTMGPSGAGKDSLLAWLKECLPPQARVHFARRTIDRPVQLEGEQHECVDTAEFTRLCNQNAFAMHWVANGLHYGIRHQELDHLQTNHWVLVNGSRAHLASNLLDYPGMVILHITASPDILRKRLLSRRRETPEMVEHRIQRSLAIEIPPECKLLEVHNNTTLHAAGVQLLHGLGEVADWPQAYQALKKG